MTIILPEGVPAGFNEIGTIYLGMVSDSGNAIAESDEADNFNFGSGFDKASLELGRRQFVHVLIHGYDPSVSSYDRDDGPWETWDGFVQRIVDEAERSGIPELRNNVTARATHWRSSEGWHSAFIDVIGYAALEIVKRRTTPPVTFLAEKLQEMFLEDATNSMARAGQIARAAATQTIADLRAPSVTGSSSILGLPSEGQWIHVIGHSRGGAVGAEVVRQLRSLGYNVDWYTALDGYSTDWPFPSNVLADINIAGTVASGGADNQINYRVQQGLAAIASSVVEDFVESYIEGTLGTNVDLGLTREFVDVYADWRCRIAPGLPTSS